MKSLMIVKKTKQFQIEDLSIDIRPTIHTLKDDLKPVLGEKKTSNMGIWINQYHLKAFFDYQDSDSTMMVFHSSMQ